MLVRSWTWSSATKTHEVEGRIYQNSRAQFFYPVQSDDAAAADEVRMAKVSLAGIEVDLSGFDPVTYAVDGGSRGVPPVIDAIGLSSFFFVPSDGVYRPGDEIVWFARFHKAVTVSGAPVLAQRIGEEMRQARYRPDLQALAGGVGLSRSLLNFASGGLPVSAPRSSILRHVSNRTVGRGQRVQGADQVA